jgi:hypothetical protein
METRFDDLRPNTCLAILIAFVLVLIVSLAQAVAPPAPTAAKAPVPGGITDSQLYQRITDRVSTGESYYTAAVQEHRQHDYPLTPFVTVRMPTLAWISTRLGATHTHNLMLALVALVSLGWLAALRPVSNAATRAAAFVLIGCATMLMDRPVPIVFHDTWAGVLIAASLALRQPGRYAASIAVGLSAVLFRELALPVLAMMAVFAAYEKQWREAACWTGAVLAAGVCIALHAAEIIGLRLPADLSSQGWIGLGGWAFFVSCVRETGAIGLMPVGAEYVVVPLSLFGWFSWKSAAGLRVSGLLVGYMLALMVFARPENLYWALLVSPLLVGGLGLAPAGLFALLKRCRPAFVTGQLKMGAAT